ncbi:MAG: hypothetical protein ABIS03_08760 [Gemmatimonadaceae bacterium]
MIGLDSGFLAAPVLLVIVLGPILFIVLWIVLGGKGAVGSTSNSPERMPQLYGYTVCLISLVWALASVMRIAENALSLSAPEMRNQYGYTMEPSVTSFEAFRTSYDRSRSMGISPDRLANLDTIPETELRRRYEALRADRIVRGTFDAQQNILTGILSLILTVSIFGFHWRWLRRSRITADMTSSADGRTTPS